MEGSRAKHLSPQRGPLFRLPCHLVAATRTAGCFQNRLRNPFDASHRNNSPFRGTTGNEERNTSPRANVQHSDCSQGGGMVKFQVRQRLDLNRRDTGALRWNHRHTHPTCVDSAPCASSMCTVVTVIVQLKKINSKQGISWTEERCRWNPPKRVSGTWSLQPLSCSP